MPKVGLKSKTVKLLRHNSLWKKEFEREASKLMRYLSKEVKGIEHVGSTAIRAMPAKPMIDIVLGVSSLNKNKFKIKCVLESNNYVQRKFRNPNQHLLFSRVVNNRTTHHVHLVRHKGHVWKRLITFRDYLNIHSIRARQYAELKKKLAKQFPNDRMKYTLAKSKFVKETLQMIKSRK